MTIVAAQDSHVDALEPQRLVDIRIGHEVSDVERQRDHGGLAASPSGEAKCMSSPSNACA